MFRSTTEKLPRSSIKQPVLDTPLRSFTWDNVTLKGGELNMISKSSHFGLCGPQKPGTPRLKNPPSPSSSTEWEQSKTASELTCGPIWPPQAATKTSFRKLNLSEKKSHAC